jgi:hypothetical protein
MTLYENIEILTNLLYSTGSFLRVYVNCNVQYSVRCFIQIWKVGKVGKVGRAGKVGKVGKVGREGLIMFTWNQL